ncbi:carbon monoxide dehydrogenase, partial [Spongiactinospora gelatinilytica]
MKVVGSAVLGVDRPRVWTALRDPAVLVHAIPGCRRLEDLGDDSYRMTVAIGVAAIKGVYQGEVTLSDLTEPERFRLKAGGQGEPGTVDATVLIRLDDAEGGGTRVEYDAEAVIGGMIGGVGAVGEVVVEYLAGGGEADREAFAGAFVAGRQVGREQVEDA